MACVSSSATRRSSPGGLGLGVATSSRVNSTSSRSRAWRALRAFRWLDGGVSLLIARSARARHPVLGRPSNALPGLQLLRLDLEEPPRLVERRLQVRGAVLAETPVRHRGGDRPPRPAPIRPPHRPGAAPPDALAQRVGLLYDEGAPRFPGQELGPRRTRGGDDPEVAVPPLVPANCYVR